MSFRSPFSNVETLSVARDDITYDVDEKGRNKQLEFQQQQKLIRVRENFVVFSICLDVIDVDERSLVRHLSSYRNFAKRRAVTRS